mgnify:CR=1 FL=1
MSKIEKTLSDRGSRYGTFENNAEVTQGIVKNLQKGSSYNKLSDIHKEAFHMIAHKMARAVCGDPEHIDNIHDIIGYATGLENYLIKLEDEKAGIKIIQNEEKNENK